MNNVEKANLSFQQKAVEEFHSLHVAGGVQASELSHAQALSSSANGSHSNTTPAIENVTTGSGDNDADEQPSQSMSI